MTIHGSSRPHWRFYVPPEVINEQGFSLTDRDEVHHAVQVMGVRPSDILTLFDGCGGEYAACVATCSRREIVFNEVRMLRSVPQEKPPVILAQSLLKGQSFDETVRVATEAGVDSIIPLITARIVPDLARAQKPQRQQRWNRIALAATKQSGRSYLPHIAAPRAFDEVLGEVVPGDCVLLCCCEAVSRRAVRHALEAGPYGRVIILIGPEGGFTDDEKKNAIHVGALAVSLGPFTFRSETAGGIAVAVVRNELAAQHTP